MAAESSNPKLTISKIRGELSFTTPKSCRFDDGGDGEWALGVLECEGIMPIQIMSSKNKNEITIDAYVSSLLQGLKNETVQFNNNAESSSIKNKLIDAQKSFEFAYKDNPKEIWRSESLKIKGKKYFYFINIMAPVEHWASWKNHVVFSQYAKF